MATELEIMSHAKDYLDQLANGINPFTNEALPETDIVNDVRISRCLFYVSDVLRQVIEKGGVKSPPKTTSVPFSLTPEQIQSFQLFEQPIFISAFTQRINSLIENPKMKRLSHRSISTFLEGEGLLITDRNHNGRTKRRPTVQGRALGIHTAVRYGSQGAYTVVLYDENAQQYILDHMDQIAALNSPSARRTYLYQQPGEKVDPETGEIVQD